MREMGVSAVWSMQRCKEEEMPGAPRSGRTICTNSHPVGDWDVIWSRIRLRKGPVLRLKIDIAGQGKWPLGCGIHPLAGSGNSAQECGPFVKL